MMGFRIRVKPESIAEVRVMLVHHLHHPHPHHLPETIVLPVEVIRIMSGFKKLYLDRSTITAGIMADMETILRCLQT
jgi:hypothetical protein